MPKKYNYTTKTGRPTKLNQELIDKIHRYHEHCIKTSEIPYLERLEIQLDISSERVSQWIKTIVESDSDKYGDPVNVLKIKFSEAIKKVKKLQRLMLQEKLIKYNSIGAMFLLKTVHGFVETSKQINEGNQVIIQVTKTGYIPEVTDAPKQAKLKPS